VRSLPFFCFFMICDRHKFLFYKNLPGDPARGGESYCFLSYPKKIKKSIHPVRNPLIFPSIYSISSVLII